ncbi:LamG-like jellyroll fold domain-containing protein [Psychroflexus salinarum]|uniref:LamG-like jellyroll fold domain-containing protein n=1 Tax=Psychroflexus salinarum TaxID=546024 RepID=A0ABW3GKX8_9FLAO
MNRKFYFLMGMLFIAFTSFSQTLDQSNAPENIGGAIFSISSTNSVGQSFTAGVTGNLSQINIRILNISGTFTPGDLQLRVLSGDGYAGTVLNTTTIEVLTVGDQFTYQELDIPLSQSIPITAGSTYTLDLQFSGNVETQALTGDPYPRGILYTNNSASNSNDLWFKTFVTADPSTHLNFDGVDDYVNLTNLISAGDSYTKQAMIRPTDISSSAGHNILSNTNEVFWIWDGNIRAGNNGSFQHVLASAASLLNTWNQVTVTYDAPSTTMKLYLNGTLVSENNSVPPTIGGNIQIGAYGSSATFNGDIDEVRIWKRALSLVEIQSNINCELQGTEAGLIAYYKFNQGLGSQDNSSITSLTDETASGLDGVLSGFALTGTSSNFLTEVANTVVNPIIIPTFEPIAAICAGEPLDALPTTSVEDISGTWSPELNNTETTTYTFTPTSGQCASSATLEIVVNELPVITANDTESKCEFGSLMLEPKVNDPNAQSAVGFVGEFAEANWDQFTQSHSNGSITFTDNTLKMVSSNTGSGITPTVNSTNIEMPYDATVTFDWSYSAGDIAENDFPLVGTNSMNLFLFTGFSKQGSSGQSGVHSISIPAGENLLLAISSNDALGSATVTISNFKVTPSNTYLWEASNGGVIFGATDELNLGVDEAGTYTLTVTNPSGCSTSKSIDVIVTESPAPVAEANQVFCSGATVSQLQAEGENLIWYNSDFDELSGTTALLSGTYFVSQTVDTCESEVTEVAVSITELPAAPTLATQQLCFDAYVSDLPVSEINNVVYQYYDTATGGTALSNDTALSTGTYYVSTFNELSSCESERSSVQVNVSTEITATVVSQNNVSCYGSADGSATVEVSGGTPPYSYEWSNGSTSPTLSGVTSGVYNLAVIDANGCGTSLIDNTPAIVTVTITEPALVEAPIVESQTFCGTTIVADLQGEGNMLKWYLEVDDTDALSHIANITTGTYYVSQTVNACESERTEVSIYISEVPDAPIAEEQFFCGASTVADLDAIGTDLSWYTNIDTPFSLNPSESINSGTYYVSGINLDGCESERTAVQVTVNSIPEPTISYDTNSESLETGVFETYQWYLGEDVIEGATSQTFQPSVNGIYTVVVTNNNCEGVSGELNLSTLSLKDFSASIGLYPNPARSEITVSYGGIDTNEVELYMYDLTGKLMGSSLINQRVQTINVSTLNEGVYLFRFVGPRVNETRKVIIKK